VAGDQRPRRLGRHHRRRPEQPPLPWPPGRRHAGRPPGPAFPPRRDPPRRRRQLRSGLQPVPRHHRPAGLPAPGVLHTGPLPSVRVRGRRGAAAQDRRRRGRREHHPGPLRGAGGARAVHPLAAAVRGRAGPGGPGLRQRRDLAGDLVRGRHPPPPSLREHARGFPPRSRRGIQRQPAVVVPLRVRGRPAAGLRFPGGPLDARPLRPRARAGGPLRRDRVDREPRGTRRLRPVREGAEAAREDPPGAAGPGQPRPVPGPGRRFLSHPQGFRCRGGLSVGRRAEPRRADRPAGPLPRHRPPRRGAQDPEGPVQEQGPVAVRGRLEVPAGHGGRGVRAWHSAAQAAQDRPGGGRRARIQRAAHPLRVGGAARRSGGGKPPRQAGEEGPEGLPAGRARAGGAGPRPEPALPDPAQGAGGPAAGIVTEPLHASGAG
jgi:hypothetical protein